MVAVQEQEKILPGGEQVAPLAPTVENPSDIGALKESQVDLKEFLQESKRQPPAQVTDDAGQTLLQATGSNQPVITISETAEQATADLKADASEGRHWLGAFVLRMIAIARKIGAKIVYKNSKS